MLWVYGYVRRRVKTCISNIIVGNAFNATYIGSLSISTSEDPSLFFMLKMLSCYNTFAAATFLLCLFLSFWMNICVSACFFVQIFLLTLCVYVSDYPFFALDGQDKEVGRRCDFFVKWEKKC